MNAIPRPGTKRSTFRFESPSNHPPGPIAALAAPLPPHTPSPKNTVSHTPSDEVSTSDLTTWIRPFATAVVATGLLGALVALRPDLMMVERVEFVGNDRASAASLRHLVDVRNGTTMWGSDLGQAETGAVQHPWVRSAQAGRKWPSTIVIEVVEYEPVAVAQWDGLRYVDKDGTLFLGSRTDDLDYPVITGIDDDLERAHPGLPPLAIRDALSLLESLDSQGLVARSEVSGIDFSRTRGFTLRLESGAELLFGLDSLEHQVERLSMLVEHQGIDLFTPVLVDLGPKRVAIVRPISPAVKPASL